MKNSNKRKIEIVLSGEAVLDGRVSVSLFTKTLQSIQEVIFEIAKLRINREPAKKGPTPTTIRKGCELFLVKTEAGSLHASMELPEREDSLFPDFPDFAEYVLKDTSEVLGAITKENDTKFHNVVPDPAYRQRILNTYIKFAPERNSDYHLEIKTQNEPSLNLIRPTKDAIIRLEASPIEPTKEEAPGLRRTVVEAKGLADVRNGDINKWVETYYMEELKFDFEHAWRPHEIRAEGRIFELVHPIACSIEKQEGIFVSEYEPLGILCYGETREEVIRELSHEFLVLWEALVEEHTINLTEDAKRLRQRLIDLVKKVKSYESKETERD